MEVVQPIEVEIPSLRVIMEEGLDKSVQVQSRYDQMNLIEEKRLTGVCHGQLYPRRLKRASDKKILPRSFQAGELELKRLSSTHSDLQGKWTPNYEGPFVIKKAFSGVALILTAMDGDDLPMPMNPNIVKKYYAQKKLSIKPDRLELVRTNLGKNGYPDGSKK